MAKYYIDLNCGSDENDGLCADKPNKTPAAVKAEAGDKVYIKRGGFCRGWLSLCSGTPDAPVEYLTYGEGAKPIFSGTVDISGASLWEDCGGNIWRLKEKLASEPCNIIFDGGKSCGNMRWEYDELQNAGEWYDAGAGDTAAGKEYSGCLYLCSVGNPALRYGKIEAALYGGRWLARGTNVILRDICFYGSGVHGFTGKPRNTSLYYCEFRFIGGCVWNRERKIRFGNAIEFWDIAENCTVENCLFHNIYDSCVTHQGGMDVTPAKNVRFVGNLFSCYGMAAYEQRDRMPVNTDFCGNICIGAGEGFAPQGEKPPRNSEIYPMPMGHHLFLWRIENPSEGGSLTVSGNVFASAPVGAAVFSLAGAAAEEQLRIDENAYDFSRMMLISRIGGREYAPAEYEKYLAETGHDGKNAKSADVSRAVAEFEKRSGCDASDVREYFGII